MGYTDWCIFVSFYNRHQCELKLQRVSDHYAPKQHAAMLQCKLNTSLQH